MPNYWHGKANGAIDALLYFAKRSLYEEKDL